MTADLDAIRAQADLASSDPFARVTISALCDEIADERFEAWVDRNPELIAFVTRRALAAARNGCTRLSAKALIEEARSSRLRVRGLVFARDGWQCRFPHALHPEVPCTGGLSYGHLRKASQGGEYTVENGITLCRVSNDWCEDNPNEAHRLGLVVRTKAVAS